MTTELTKAAQQALEDLHSIGRYGFDTLSGRSDGGPDDRNWQRDAVREMSHRAQKARKALQAALTQQATPERRLTVTTNQQGEAVMVSWQDDEHRILEVVWERKQATPEPSRGMIGMGAHALANELAQAVAQDDADPDGHDMPAGLFGPNVSAWLRKVATEYLSQPATPEPVGEPWGWAVNSTLFRGEFAEADAKAETKRCGGTTRAVALYTHPALSAPNGNVLVPLQVLKDASEALGNFVSDHGWGDSDMQAMDNLDAIIAQHDARAKENQA